MQLEVDEAVGSVTLSSLGREPVSVNHVLAAQPVQLCSGDQIEVPILFNLPPPHPFISRT